MTAIEGKVGEIQQWIDANPSATVEEIDGKKDEFDSIVRPILSNVSGGTGGSGNGGGHGGSADYATARPGADGPIIEEVD